MHYASLSEFISRLTLPRGMKSRYSPQQTLSYNQSLREFQWLILLHSMIMFVVKSSLRSGQKPCGVLPSLLSLDEKSGQNEYQTWYFMTSAIFNHPWISRANLWHLWARLDPRSERPRGMTTALHWASAGATYNRVIETTAKTGSPSVAKRPLSLPTAV